MERTALGFVISKILLFVIVGGGFSFIESCGSGGSSAGGSGLSAGSGITLTGAKVVVQIPTGSFSSDMTVSLSENGADTSGLGNVQLLSNTATLDFSQAMMVESDPIEIRIALNATEVNQAIAAGSGIYAKVRVKGEQISFDRDTSDDDAWIPIIGELDDDRTTMTLKLYSSADVIDVVAVAGAELQIVAIDSPSFSLAKSIGSAKSVGKAVNTVGMGDYPWAVVCNTDTLSDHGAATCDATNANSQVVTVQNGMTDASKNLRDKLNMSKLIIQQLSALSLAQTNLSALPTPEVLRRYDPHVKYNMVYFVGGTASVFNTATGVLKVDETKVGNDVYTQKVGEVMHHELAHAVQAAACLKCFKFEGALDRSSPLTEGSAAAVGMLAAVNWSSSAVQGMVSDGKPRNWANSLAKYDPYTDSYYMTEFFTLANNGDLTYLMPLYTAFNGTSAGAEFNKNLNTAINTATGQSLPDIFLKRVMPARSHSSPNAVHYTEVDVTNTDIDHSTVSTLPSMASDQYLFRDTSDGDVCINVNIFQGSDPDLALVMLNGTEGGEAMPFGEDYVARIATNGDVLTVNGHTADVQVVNMSTGFQTDKMTYTISAYVDGSCQPPAGPVACNPMKVVCSQNGCGLYVQAFDGACWARAVSCDALGRCTQSGFEGGFDFGSCDNLQNQMTMNIPVGDAVTDNPATVPDDRQCGGVDLGCQWIVLCPK